MTEKETSFEIGEKVVKVTELGALGYGNPDAAISCDKKVKSGELHADVAQTTVEFILSGEGMVTVNHTDDGCIDGRPTEAIIFIEDGEEKVVESHGIGHERFKVAGGGYITGTAMTLGAADPQVTLQEQVAYTADLFHQAGIVCGAHTDGHENEQVCGCGANDKFADILMNGLRYGDAIRENVKAFSQILGSKYDDIAMQKAMNRWATVLQLDSFLKGSTGQSRLEIIKEMMKRDQKTSGQERPVSVIKRLAGGHNEAFTLVNFKDGETFSQGGHLTKLRKKYPNLDSTALPQVFVVDIPRVIEFSQAVHEKTGYDLNELTYGGFAFQLATAATLTDGTLRTFIVQ